MLLNTRFNVVTHSFFAKPSKRLHFQSSLMLPGLSMLTLSFVMQPSLTLVNTGVSDEESSAVKQMSLQILLPEFEE